MDVKIYVLFSYWEMRQIEGFIDVIILLFDKDGIGFKIGNMELFDIY